MSKDRELLEWASKAAGIELDWDVPPKSPPWRMSGVGQDRGPAAQWNPLSDDGDRLRLARHLGISINFADCCAWKRLPDGGLIQEFWGGECGDEAHAVLRVAAEIGKHSAPSKEES